MAISVKASWRTNAACKIYSGYPNTYCDLQTFLLLRSLCATPVFLFPCKRGFFCYYERMTIGIPKAFLYWKSPGYWETFFESLGCKVVVSPPSDKNIVELGVQAADPETCFANKIYWGHVKWLEGKCDKIFAPRLKTNEAGQEYCPKFFAIPDLARIVTKTPLLTASFDSRKEAFIMTLQRLGREVGVSKKDVLAAKTKCDDGCAGIEKKNRENFWRKMDSDKQKILLISHPYNLYDEYCNLQVEKKLNQLDGEAIFLDEAASLGSGGEFASKGVPSLHWEFGLEMLKMVPSVLARYRFDAGIEISSFQCGCDAVIKGYVEDVFRARKTPFLYLIIDEQTGEAGYQTRLEAFCDTINARA